MSEGNDTSGGRRGKGKARPARGPCDRGVHLWVARFLDSGRLAFWQCAECRRTDGEPPPWPAQLEPAESSRGPAPTIAVRGRKPPVGTRRWATVDGDVLCEGDPSSTHFSGDPIPGLAEAHTYVLRDASEAERAVYAPERHRLEPYAERYVLTRYQVVDRALVRFESSCFEESTFDTPNAGEPKRSIVLEGLQPLPIRSGSRRRGGGSST